MIANTFSAMEPVFRTAVGLRASVGILLLGCTLCSSTWASDAVVMRVSHEKLPEHWFTQLLREWGRDIDGGTHGAIRVELGEHDKFAKPEENFEAVRAGVVEAAMTEPNEYQAIVPETAVLLKPYAFASPGSMERFLESPLRQQLDAKFEHAGVHPLGWLGLAFVTGFGAYTRPVVLPGDLKGKVVRQPSEVLRSTFEALGITPWEGDDLFKAIENHRLDALMTDMSQAYRFKTLRAWTTLPLWRVVGVVYINAKWWRQLTPDLQSIITSTTRRYERVSLERGPAATCETTGAVTRAGAIVRPATAEENAKLMRVSGPAYDEYFRNRVGAAVAGRLLKELAELGAPSLQAGSRSGDACLK
jgi:TRAP-type C4-dicarboxylate transport system substrate-binding protein